MAIKTGIGIGEAQVYDTSGIISNFGKLIQKQQQDEAKFQNEIANIIANVDTKGVRDADKGEIAKMYDATKDLYRQAAQAKNFQDKALLKAKISKAVNDINEYANNSAAWVKKYESIANNVAANPWQYDPKIVDKLKGLKDKPLLAMGDDIALDPFEYQRIPNIKSRENLFDDIRKRGEQFAKFTTKSIGGGKEQYTGLLGDDKIREFISTNIMIDPEYRSTALTQWSKMNPGKPVDLKNVIDTELALYKSQYGTEYKSAPTRIPKDTSGKDNEDKLTYRQGLISGILTKDNDALDELLSVFPANTKGKFLTSKAIPGVSKGGYNFLRITIPESTSPTGVEIVEDIPLQAGKPILRLNSLINQYSGERISPSQISIKGGKKTGEKFDVPANGESIPSGTRAQWRNSGWSDAQIDQALKLGKIKIIQDAR